MIVVSDTSPILSLTLIGRLDLLRDLYGTIVIPEAVRSEIIATNQVDPHDASKGTDALKEAFNTIDAGTPKVFAGNRADVTTLDDMIELLEDRYGQARRIWVFDRGIVSEDNLAALRARGARYVVGTPKSMLRSKASASSLQLLEESHFQLVIDDSSIQDASAVKRVILCSGKVFYDLAETRNTEGLAAVAVVRIEQLYPFPRAEVMAELSRYVNAREITGCQEEPQNQGARYCIKHEIEACVAEHQLLFYAGRSHDNHDAVHRRSTRMSTCCGFFCTGLSERMSTGKVWYAFFSRPSRRAITPRSRRPRTAATTRRGLPVPPKSGSGTARRRRIRPKPVRRSAQEA